MVFKRDGSRHHAEQSAPAEALACGLLEVPKAREVRGRGRCRLPDPDADHRPGAVLKDDVDLLLLVRSVVGERWPLRAPRGTVATRKVASRSAQILCIVVSGISAARAISLRLRAVVDRAAERRRIMGNSRSRCRLPRSRTSFSIVEAR